MLRTYINSTAVRKTLNVNNLLQNFFMFCLTWRTNLKE